MTRTFPNCSSDSVYHVYLQNNHILPTLRCFTSSPSLNKKKDKNPPSSNNNSTPNEASDDVLDLSKLQRDIDNVTRRLGDDLSKLSAGARFITEAIESLRVHLVKGSKETVKLGELTQIIPKGGRMVTVLAADEEVSLSQRKRLSG